MGETYFVTSVNRRLEGVKAYDSWRDAIAAFTGFLKEDPSAWLRITVQQPVSAIQQVIIPLLTSLKPVKIDWYKEVEKFVDEKSRRIFHPRLVDGLPYLYQRGGREAVVQDLEGGMFEAQGGRTPLRGNMTEQNLNIDLRTFLREVPDEDFEEVLRHYVAHTNYCFAVKVSDGSKREAERNQILYRVFFL